MSNTDTCRKCNIEYKEDDLLLAPQGFYLCDLCGFIHFDIQLDDITSIAEPVNDEYMDKFNAKKQRAKDMLN